MRFFLYTMTAALTVLPAFAQKYEFALAGGGSFYQSHTVTNPKGDASAGFENGWAGSVAVGNNMYQHVGGEIRYTYLHNDAKLSSGSTKATFGAESHAIHYDFLIHATSTESTIRPYVAAGGGIKFYRGTGTEVPFQPLSNIALLTKTTEVQGLLSVGAGVKVALDEPDDVPRGRPRLHHSVPDRRSLHPRRTRRPAAGSITSSPRREFRSPSNWSIIVGKWVFLTGYWFLS